MTLDLDEALRYLGAGDKAPPELREQVRQVAGDLTGRIRPRFTYRISPVVSTPEAVCLPALGLTLPGRSARLMLETCSQAAVLACTLGAECDALLRSAQARDMARAVILDACASSYVEAGCDGAEEDISRHFPGKYRSDRFSPGYGDLPLSLQPAITAALDTPRRIGLYVTDSLMLSPSKSVTAIVGLSDQPQMRRIRGCAYCSMRNTCTLRKGGKTCAP